MLGENNVHVDIAVSDLPKSQKFYEEILGLKKIKATDNEVYYQSGNSTVKIYQTEFAGTNQATYASWDVEDVAKAVEQLKTKGVMFEHYDMPGVTQEGDVHVRGDVRAAWFKDPDGNILCVGNIVEVT